MRDADVSDTGVEVWRGGVASWECDAFGHLNVGFYVAKSMEALVGVAAELGMGDAFSPAARATLVVRDQHIRFLREARPGAALTMTAGVVDIGESEARVLLVMRHASGDIAATFQVVVAHVTARDGRAFPWPERVRRRAEALRVEVPPQARPRSISFEPAVSGASLEAATALGLRRTALGAVRAQDCDAFGRMRTELFMARISDGGAHLFAGLQQNDGDRARIGGAALEYRLAYFDWPHAGDRVELRSAWTAADARLRRMAHWLLDPVTGRPWAAAQSIAAAFDLDTRKLISLSEESLAAISAQVIEGVDL